MLACLAALVHLFAGILALLALFQRALWLPAEVRVLPDTSCMLTSDLGLVAWEAYPVQRMSRQTWALT